MTALPITSLYAGLLGLVLLWLSLRAVQGRVKHEVSLGDGGHPDLLVAMRAQGNFVEYVPLALLLIGLCEAGGTPPALLHGLGAALLLARIAHPFGLYPEFAMQPARFLAVIATWGVVALASGLAIWSFFARGA